MVVLHLYYFLLFCLLVLVSHALPEVQPGAAQNPPSGLHHEALSDASDVYVHRCKLFCAKILNSHTGLNDRSLLELTSPVPET